MLKTMETRNLICCPACDAVYTVTQPGPGERATCARCHTHLIVPRRKAGKQIIALAVSVLVLAVAACTLPFITIGMGGLHNQTSIFGVAFAFSEIRLTYLSLLVAALIVIIPVARVSLVLYVLVPVVLNRPPARRARTAFRYSEELRPWAMAEVFALGCAVALIKIRELAEVGLGPAFWMFGAVAAIMIVQDNFICRWSVWRSIETQTQKS